jgi:hypothetical protein
MATLNQQLQKSKKLTPEKIVKDVFAFIKTIEKELTAYNVATLHQYSEDVLGKPIGFYSKASELISGKTGAFDLLDSGDFLESIYSKVQNDSIFFDASDSKKKEVMSNLLSDNIFGLQEDDLNKVIKTRILPQMQKIIRKGLGI